MRSYCDWFYQGYCCAFTMSHMGEIWVTGPGWYHWRLWPRSGSSSITSACSRIRRCSRERVWLYVDGRALMEDACDLWRQRLFVSHLQRVVKGRGRVTSLVWNECISLSFVDCQPSTMGGDHKCPVCDATFTRPQHVARHMRSRSSSSLCSTSRRSLFFRHGR